MHAYQAFPIRPACGEGRHVFVSLGTAEEPAAHGFLQPCMCGESSFGWEEVSAWGHPMWAAAPTPEKADAMAQHVIRTAAGGNTWNR